MDFIDQHCTVFDSEEESSHELTKIHENFVETVFDPHWEQQEQQAQAQAAEEAKKKEEKKKKEEEKKEEEEKEEETVQAPADASADAPAEEARLRRGAQPPPLPTGE
jgi:hypothetical protein